VRAASAARRQLAWLAGGYALAFAVPFLLADRLALPRDLYYALYVAAVGGFLTLWLRSSGRPAGPLVARRWKLVVVLGVVFGGLLALMVVRAEDGSLRPDALTLSGEVLWRGVVYGAVDGLLLSSFPILAVWWAFDERRRSPLRQTVAIALIALVVSLGMTAVYHAGYSDFRSGKLAKPVAGDVAWSMPTLLTLNPIGAPIAHASMHAAAVVHDGDTELFLPPHR
jgi:hypothetical protein